MSLRVGAIEGPDVLCTVVDGGSLGSRCADGRACGGWPAAEHAQAGPALPRPASASCCIRPARFFCRRRHLSIRGKSANLPAITDRDWADIRWGVQVSARK